MDILSYTFFQHALLGATLASILCGMVGTYIVTRRLVFISGGLTHASFGGIGLGVFFGFSPLAGALVFAVLSALGVQWMSEKADIREDSTIAFFWTLGMSIGIICCFLSPSFVPDLNAYLFGNILTIGRDDLLLIGVVTVGAALLFLTCCGTLVSISFDPVYSRVQRLPVDFLNYLMMVLIALTIVATLRIVGIVLAISMLTIPQMTAAVLTYNYRKMIGWSILIGWVDCMVGLTFSYLFNVPSGATIILVGIVVYCLVRTVKILCNKRLACH